MQSDGYSRGRDAKRRECSENDRLRHSKKMCSLQVTPDLLTGWLPKIPKKTRTVTQVRAAKDRPDVRMLFPYRDPVTGVGPSGLDNDGKAADVTAGWY